MLAALAVILVVLWLLGFLAFHVTSGLIHILLIVALISLAMHFVRGEGRRRITSRERVRPPALHAVC